LLCQASIREGEERFVTEETVAEGIRRALWNTSSSTSMDVMEFVLRYLPLLPVNNDNNDNNDNKSHANTTTTASTSLPLPLRLMAERAQMRLLEDALYDACENEGDEELVESLEIAATNRKSKRTKR
jgi:hypothetical protein